MDLTRFERLDAYSWSLRSEPGQERLPVVLFGSQPLLETIDDKVLQQVSNVAGLPGLVGSASQRWARPGRHAWFRDLKHVIVNSSADQAAREVRTDPAAGVMMRSRGRTTSGLRPPPGEPERPG